MNSRDLLSPVPGSRTTSGTSTHSFYMGTGNPNSHLHILLTKQSPHPQSSILHQSPSLEYFVIATEGKEKSLDSLCPRATLIYSLCFFLSFLNSVVTVFRNQTSKGVLMLASTLICGKGQDVSKAISDFLRQVENVKPNSTKHQQSCLLAKAVRSLPLKHEKCSGNIYTVEDRRSKEGYLTEPARKGRNHRPVARNGDELRGLQGERDMRAESERYLILPCLQDVQMVVCIQMACTHPALRVEGGDVSWECQMWNECSLGNRQLRLLQEQVM